jgi:tripartite-type tricarboxylate transporter receptor subunit TctC
MPLKFSMGVAMRLLLTQTAAQPAPTSSGQAYAQRPVRLVVTVAAGGSTDIMARLIGAKLGERIGQQVVDKLNTALVAIMKDPDMRERLIKQGAEPLGGTPAELRQYLAGEMAKWGKVIRDAGIRAD